MYVIILHNLYTCINTVLLYLCWPHILYIALLCKCLLLSLFIYVFLAVDVPVPDGGMKNFSGESRNKDRSQRASSDPQLKDLCGSHTLDQTVVAKRTHAVIHCDDSGLFPVNSNDKTKSSGELPCLSVYCNTVLTGSSICLWIEPPQHNIILNTDLYVHTSESWHLNANN